MKITAPISRLEELEMLLANGADELYCGLHIPEWEKKHGSRWWLNRRDPVQANLATAKDLKEIVSQAHEQDVAIHMTVNSPYYPRNSLVDLTRYIAGILSDIPFDSLIISDINLLSRLSAMRLPVSLHLSSLGACYNSGSVAFYKSLGVKRIILSRHLRLSEIKHLVKRNRHQMEFEVFALNDGCYFEEGLCQTSHALGAFCMSGLNTTVSANGKTGLTPKKMAEKQEELQEYLWFQNNCGSSYHKNGLPNGPCSLCAFGLFRDWGVHAVKVVGREASFHRKLGSMQLTRAVMDLVQQGCPTEEIAELSRHYRDTPELCDKGYLCYFREQNPEKTL